MPTPSIADTLHALKAKTIRKEDAIDLLIPELDRLLALDLVPVAGGLLEAISDQFLRPAAGAIVNAALRAWAKERKTKAVKS